jgi:hypothetical protein
VSNNEVCDACLQAKCHQLPYPTSTSIVFSDVWGPACASVGHNSYYVSFIDDFSKFPWIYLLKHKSKVFHQFQEFQCMVERLFDRKIHAMQTNLGGGGGGVNIRS